MLFLRPCKHILLVSSFLFIASLSFAQVTLCSWNLEDLGKSKSDSEINFIANTLTGYDVVAIQEVVAKDPAGAQAVARLAGALNRKGAKWLYTVSNITSGANSYKNERYAFLWKPSKLTLVGKPWLEAKYDSVIDREPYLATFSYNGKQFTLVNFHAVTQSKQPEKEIKYFKYLPAAYPGKRFLFCGDFNCPPSHTVFNPLKAMGYRPVFTQQKTSLKMACDGDDCLASEFDNIWYDPSFVQQQEKGVVLFYKNCKDIEEARRISDHIPVWFRFMPL